MKTLRCITLILCLCTANIADAQSGVWQWKADIRNHSKKPAYQHPVAYLWIPQNCTEVKALIVAQHNMEEISILEDGLFREAMSRLGVAQLWICPRYNLTFNFTDGAWETLQQTLDTLAAESGYEEIASVPIIGMGHSAAASAPYYMAASRKDRVLACISTSGQWPYFREEPFAPDIWGDKDIDFVPCLETMGEYEAAESFGDRGVRERQEHPALPLSMLACPAEGHFASSAQKAGFIALFIAKALQYGHVDPRKTGWLAEKWYADREPSCEPAPVSEYKGDRSKAFWYFDEETARAAVAYGERFRGKKRQLVGVKLFGEEVPQRNTHMQLHPALRTESDGLTIELTPFFYDSVGDGSPRLSTWSGLPAGSAIGHSSTGDPYLEMIAAPAVVSGPQSIRLSWNRMASWEEKEVFVDFVIKHDGDGEYRPAVQQARITLPIRLKEGEPQSIEFAPIGNVPAGTEFIKLQAASSSGLEVGFYAECGPVKVEGNTLIFEQLPPRTKYPVKVSVVAWQYGRPSGEKIQSAEPVRREFSLVK